MLVNSVESTPNPASFLLRLDAPLEGFAPPSPEEFEVQVVCWKSRDVMAMDAGNMNDLYGVFFMEGGTPQETDTHWRCYAGEGSWNWRLKFDVTLPMKPEMARLHIQLWDRDVVKVSFFFRFFAFSRLEFWRFWCLRAVLTYLCFALCLIHSPPSPSSFFSPFAPIHADRASVCSGTM